LNCKVKKLFGKVIFFPPNFLLLRKISLFPNKKKKSREKSRLGNFLTGLKNNQKQFYSFLVLGKIKIYFAKKFFKLAKKVRQKKKWENLFCSVNFFPAKFFSCSERFPFSKIPEKILVGKKLTE
jgi:hypothetical protein